ncbi:hypothetical protein KP509_16G030900 [Ceratopteris richardii]|uniref:Uncharacterized protein n=1 Tax=Ceratopteris richardii TaxID=49495 RepID=A0A8T2SXP3_CERRI|nr:hypothetical protein KP509_16G030900 [Ceratopteris richardii]
MSSLTFTRCQDNLRVHQQIFTPCLTHKFRSGLIHIPCCTRNARGVVSFSHHVRYQAAQNPSASPQPDNEVVKGNGIHENDSNSTGGEKESIMVKLRRYGVAGMLSYGLLNTIYYLGTFLFAWFYIAPAPSGLGYRAAAERFLKLFALVWAGSQVTKLLRAGCALAFAPIIEKGLTWLTENSRFRSRAEVFGLIVGFCFGLALIVFLVITFLWA